MNPNTTNVPRDGHPHVDGGRGSKPRRLGLRHAMGRDWYLFKVELHLDGKVSGRHRKSILAELKDSINAESQISPLSDVLAGLGRPGELAASYAEGASLSRPLWGKGVAAAMSMLIVYWLFLATYTLGMLSVVSQTGGEFHSQFFLVNVMAFSEDDGMGVGWSGRAALWFPVFLAAAAFIPASRLWRLFRRNRR